MTVREIIRRVVREDGLMLCCEIGRVKSIDKSKNTCECSIEGKADVLGARLALAVQGKESIVIYPKVGSDVLLGFVSGATAFVLMSGQVEEITINGGENKGLIKIEEMKKQLSLMSGRIDTIIQALQQSAVAPGDGGATYKAGINELLATISQKEDFSHLEDEKIKH
jgi:hypothetical protein